MLLDHARSAKPGVGRERRRAASGELEAPIPSQSQHPRWPTSPHDGGHHQFRRRPEIQMPRAGAPSTWKLLQACPHRNAVGPSGRRAPRDQGYRPGIQGHLIAGAPPPARPPRHMMILHGQLRPLSKDQTGLNVAQAPDLDFYGGDDGTRTHDPLLAKNEVDSPQASTRVSTRHFGRLCTPTVCPGGYCGGYCRPIP